MTVVLLEESQTTLQSVRTGKLHRQGDTFEPYDLEPYDLLRVLGGPARTSEPTKRPLKRKLDDTPNASSKRLRHGSVESTVSLLPNVTDFKTLRSLFPVYFDMTRFILKLLQSQTCHVDGRFKCIFRRPPGSGKTTFLSTLAYYHDIKSSSSFDRLFNGLDIFNHVKKNDGLVEHNCWLVLIFDFNVVRNWPHSVKDSLQKYLNEVLREFLEKYKEELFGSSASKDLINPEDGLRSLRNVLKHVQENDLRLFLGVDSYNSPYTRVPEVRTRDLLESFFFHLILDFSGGAYGSCIERIFIVGDDAEYPVGSATRYLFDYTYSSPLRELGGFTMDQVKQLYSTYLEDTDFKDVLNRLRDSTPPSVFLGENYSDVELYNMRKVLNFMKMEIESPTST